MGDVKRREAAAEARLGAAADDAKGQVGVLLPGVDPTIGEIVLTTYQANPDVHPATLLAVLARQAPTVEVAAELVTAGMELVVARDKGHLVWLADKAGDYLVGIRRSTLKAGEGIMFGPKHWPWRALMTGPPIPLTVQLGKGMRVVWASCEGLEGVILRQSSVIALGNALVERFGAKIVEDRQGPDVMRNAVIEGRMTDRAKARAAAVSALERHTVLAAPGTPRSLHARVALAEALPGTVQPGRKVHPEDAPTKVYVVDSRVNESWVLLVAEGPGDAFNVEAGTVWLLVDKPWPLEDDATAGFTDDAAVAPQPIPLPVLTPATELDALPEPPQQEDTGGAGPREDGDEGAGPG